MGQPVRSHERENFYRMIVNPVTVRKMTREEQIKYLGGVVMEEEINIRDMDMLKTKYLGVAGDLWTYEIKADSIQIFYDESNIIIGNYTPDNLENLIKEFQMIIRAHRALFT